jgi:hypothetical protein
MPMAGIMSFSSMIFLLLSTIPLPAANGGFLQTSSIVDFQGDFVIHSVSTFTYDSRGRVAEVITVRQWSVFEAGMALDTQTFHYDTHGKLLFSVDDFDNGGDGSIDSRATTTFSSLNATQKQAITVSDDRFDGTIDRILTETSTYDDRGRLIRVETDSDINADGIPENRTI